MTSELRRSYCDQDIRCVMGRSCGKSKDTQKAGSKEGSSGGAVCRWSAFSNRLLLRLDQVWPDT